MERVYSALFSTRYDRQSAELTKETLERHNAAHEKQDQDEWQFPTGRDGDDDEKPPVGEEERVEDPTPVYVELDADTVIRELKSSVRAALRAGLFAYGAKGLTAILLASRKWNSIEYGYADAVRLLVRPDTLRFSAFLGSLVGVFRVSELSLRAMRSQKDRTNLAIAGGISGLTMLLDSPSRRSTISLYIFVRMLDIVGRHLTAVKAIPDWKYSSETLFGLSNAFIMYAFIARPELVEKGYRQWIANMGSVTTNGIEYTVGAMARGDVDSDGNPLPFRPCQPHYHMDSCMTHSVKTWAGGLGRAMQLYTPVHVLPALIFRSQQLRERPFKFIYDTSFATLRSSSFLTSYQTLMKLIICTIRNTFQQDYLCETWLAGLGTGFTLFFEHPKRRLELMLYCFPRALDIIWRMLKERGIVRYVRHSETALFCVSMALIMSSPPAHIKSTYLQILRFIFGHSII